MIPLRLDPKSSNTSLLIPKDVRRSGPRQAEDAQVPLAVIEWATLHHRFPHIVEAARVQRRESELG